MTNPNPLHQTQAGHATSEESEAKWQKHVIVALWVVIGVLVAVAAALMWAAANGWFGSSGVQTIPSWPTSWP
jgi:hypothetical protein